MEAKTVAGMDWLTLDYGNWASTIFQFSWMDDTQEMEGERWCQLMDCQMDAAEYHGLKDHGWRHSWIRDSQMEEPWSSRSQWTTARVTGKTCHYKPAVQASKVPTHPGSTWSSFPILGSRGYVEHIHCRG